MSSQPLVLIVDDEAEIRETVLRRLRVEGIAAETAPTPRQALEQMRKGLYPIAICDIRMPGMDGVELLQELKKINPLCNVIMMTGYSSMAHVVNCLGSGAVDYFVKPFQDIDGVVEAVRQAQQRVERWRQAVSLKAEGRNQP